MGTAGPLEAVKGHVFFLGAAQRVAAAHPETEFLVAGAGPEEENLRRLARELGINRNVTFASNLYDFSRRRWRRWIFFASPRCDKGWGRSCSKRWPWAGPSLPAEWAASTASFATTRRASSCPPPDSTALAERILELLHDPVRARAIGEAGRQLVREEFGVERMVAQTADLYREILASERVATPTVVV